MYHFLMCKLTAMEKEGNIEEETTEQETSISKNEAISTTEIEEETGISTSKEEVVVSSTGDSTDVESQKSTQDNQSIFKPQPTTSCTEKVIFGDWK